MTMATSIQPSVRQPGTPRLASSTAVSANGSAKIECSHLIISSVMRVFAASPIACSSIFQCKRSDGCADESRRGIAPAHKLMKKP